MAQASACAILAFEEEDMRTIRIEEIPVENIEEFWNIHIKYLIEDSIITDEEDIDYAVAVDYTILSNELDKAETLELGE